MTAPLIAGSPPQPRAAIEPLVNRVTQSDCMEILGSLPESCVDLVYLDPPFNTGRDMVGHSGRFADQWADVDDYLNFMRPRIEAIHRVLKPTGSILLHCDWRTCHHFRCLLDDVFGGPQFINHLIWRYGLGGSSPRRFARKHDDILFYGKTDAYFFNPPRVPATSARMKGQMKKATDVLDIPSINNMAAERTGYPTQKPLALLDMLILACSPAGGLVLDPFCGSGTTLVAARSLGRLFVGIDRNPDAVKIARERLGRLEAGISASNRPTGR